MMPNPMLVSFQELAHVFGGKVAPGLKREYGKASVSRVAGCNSPLFAGLPEEFIMWMSHGDKLHVVPDGFKAVGMFRCVNNEHFCFVVVRQFALYFCKQS